MRPVKSLTFAAWILGLALALGTPARADPEPAREGGSSRAPDVVEFGEDLWQDILAASARPSSTRAPLELPLPPPIVERERRLRAGGLRAELRVRVRALARLRESVPRTHSAHASFAAYLSTLNPVWDQALVDARTAIARGDTLSLLSADRTLGGLQTAFEMASVYRASLLHLHREATESVHGRLMAAGITPEERARTIREWEGEETRARTLLEDLTNPERPAPSPEEVSRMMEATARLELAEARRHYLLNSPEVQAWLRRDTEVRAVLLNLHLQDLVRTAALRRLNAATVGILAGNAGLVSLFLTHSMDISLPIGMAGLAVTAGSAVVAGVIGTPREIRLQLETLADQLERLRTLGRQREWVEYVERIHRGAAANPTERADLRLRCAVHRLMGQSCAFGAGLNGEAPCRSTAGPHR